MFSYVDQRVIIEMERKARNFFSNLSLFEIEKYFILLFRGLKGFSFYQQEFEKSQLLTDLKKILESSFPDLLDFPALIT